MRESISIATYSGVIADSYKEERINNNSVYAFDFQLKITILGSSFTPKIKVVAYTEKLKSIISNFIIKENIGKRLEVAGIEVPGDDGSILFIQRLIFDELLISKSEADKKANDKVDLSDMDNMYQ